MTTTFEKRINALKENGIKVKQHHVINLVDRHTGEQYFAAWYNLEFEGKKRSQAIVMASNKSTIAFNMDVCDKLFFKIETIVVNINNSLK